MKTKTFRCNIDPENKVLTFYNKPSLEKFLDDISGDVLVTIVQPDDIRSKEQNRHYWGIIDLLRKDETFAGYTKNELHAEFKRRFHVESTKDLETGEFINYIEDIKAFAMDFAGIHIKDPEDY